MDISFMVDRIEDFRVDISFKAERSLEVDVRLFETVWKISYSAAVEDQY